MSTLLIVSGAVPVFVRVAVFALLVVFTSCDPKPRLLGVRLTAGAGVVPVPVSETSRGLPDASSVIVRVAARAPAAVGVNVTEIVQLALTASVLGPVGQVFVCAYSAATAR